MESFSSYPNLERYLERYGVVDDLHNPRRPDFWLILLAPLASVCAFLELGWQWGLCVLAGFSFVAYLVIRRRAKAKPMLQLSAEASRAKLPLRIRSLAKSGKLSAVVGATGAAALERCATLAIQARADFARACGASGSAVPDDLRKDIARGITLTMEHAFAGFEHRLMSPKASAPTDLLMVVEAERELELLVSAVATWVASMLEPSLHPEISQNRDHFKWLPTLGLVSAPESSTAAGADREHQLSEAE